MMLGNSLLRKNSPHGENWNCICLPYIRFISFTLDGKSGDTQTFSALWASEYLYLALVKGSLHLHLLTCKL